jgi:hypothetical protein
MENTTTSPPAPGPTSLVATAAPYATRPRALALTLAHHLDLIVLLVGVVIALALGGPVFGLLVGAGGWLLQRAIAVVNRALIDRRMEPGSRLGPDFIEAFARVWLLAAAIILAGAAGHRSDGLAAALVIVISYSIAFAVRIARGRPPRGAER